MLTTQSGGYKCYKYCVILQCTYETEVTETCLFQLIHFYSDIEKHIGDKITFMKNIAWMFIIFITWGIYQQSYRHGIVCGDSMQTIIALLQQTLHGYKVYVCMFNVISCFTMHEYACHTGLDCSDVALSHTL